MANIGDHAFPSFAADIAIAAGYPFKVRTALSSVWHCSLYSATRRGMPVVLGAVFCYASHDGCGRQRAATALDFENPSGFTMNIDGSGDR